MAEEKTHRTGVIICECGQEIAGVLDTEALRCQAAEIPGVVYSKSDVYPCSKDGCARLCEAVEEYGLKRVLIAGCAPRLVNKLFQKTVEEAGLHPDFVGIVDIREGCAYAHPDEIEGAFEKGLDTIKMGIARLAAISPGQEKSITPVRSSLVIGSGLSGLTSILMLADSGVSVTLLERSDQLGGKLFPMQVDATDLVAEKIETVKKHPNIRLMFKAKVQNVSGQPGNYHVSVSQNDQTTDLDVGAILVAGGAQPQEINGYRYYGRTYVQNPIEFEDELREAEDNGLSIHDIVIVLYGGGFEGKSTPLNSFTAIRQALMVKQLDPKANVTILFRDLILGTAGGKGDEDFQWAKDQGVTFFRYQQEHPPIIDEQMVKVYDPLTDDTLDIPCDRVVLSLPILPRTDTDSLAKLFHLPQDNQGFLVERRSPLRPGNNVDDGIFVLGSAHMPIDTAETLFQAYLIGTRAMQFLSQETLSAKTPIAEVDPALCTGCGNCVQVCMTDSIHLEARDGVLSLAEVDNLRCTGCGNCAVACPVKAIAIPGWSDQAILAQISAALESVNHDKEVKEKSKSPRRILAMTCEWSAFLAAEVAGARHLPYTADIRVLPVNCSARFDPDHILWAFLNGADGVFLGACHPCDCHYGKGSLYAQERVEDLKKQLAFYGVDARRLHLEYLSGDNDEGFINAITDFTCRVDKCKTTLKKEEINPARG